VNLIFRGEVGDNQSWGISTIGNVSGFLANGANVTLQPTNAYGGCPQKVSECVNNNFDHYDVFIRQGLAEHMLELRDVPSGIKKISLSCWDSDLITPEAAEIHNKYVDGVLALSKFTKKAFQDAGVTIPIHVGGQGVDTRLFRPRKKAKREEESYKFLSVCVAQGRKGTQELISAFGKTFSEEENVELIIKSNSWGNLKDFTVNHSKVKLIYLEYTPEELASLYRKCDCFVMPTQGDSFMLPGLEASASGLPLIITDFGGPKDYCTVQTGYLLKCTLKEAGYLPGHQAVPDVEHLSYLMRYVTNHAQEARFKGFIGSEIANRYWTWEEDAKRNLKFLDEVPFNE